jgi:hypothetical protein
LFHDDDLGEDGVVVMPIMCCLFLLRCRRLYELLLLMPDEILDGDEAISEVHTTVSNGWFV